MLQETVKLGEGIYTASDAANILKLPYRKINYWFNKYLKMRFEQSANFRYFFTVDNSVAVNFYTLIEIYVFYQLKENKISSHKIVDAHNAIAGILNTKYPFAKSEMLVSGGGILFKYGEDIISADKKLQYNIKKVIIPFSHKIEFDNNNFAHKYYPLGKKNAVVVNPKNQFGQPIIEGTNIAAQTIIELHESGESIKMISKLYDISQKQVKDAIQFNQAA